MLRDDEIETPAVLDAGCGFFSSGLYKIHYSGSFRTLDKLPKVEGLIYPDEAVNYSVPREIAEDSVSLTLKYLEKARGGTGGRSPLYGAVINGGRYPDLREKCARGVKKHGPKMVMIANSKSLLSDPRVLVETLVRVRSVLGPEVLIFFPEPTPYSLPLLCLLGADLFSDLGLKSVKERYSLAGFIPSERPFQENKGLLECLLRQTRHAIMHGAIERLAETASSTSPSLMAALRILYMEYNSWWENLVPSCRFQSIPSAFLLRARIGRSR
jgi:predicted RNA-binding protein